MFVVDLNAVRERRQEEAFNAYVAARGRAEETLAVEDGLAAGRAWRRFLDLFISPEQRASLEGADRFVRSRWSR